MLTSQHLFVDGGHFFLNYTESFCDLTCIFLTTIKRHKTTNSEYSRVYLLDNYNVYTHTFTQFVGNAVTILDC